jgi:hypothetical protein
LEVASAGKEALMKSKDNPALTPSLSDKNQQVLRNQIIDDKFYVILKTYLSLSVRRVLASAGKTIYFR